MSTLVTASESNKVGLSSYFRDGIVLERQKDSLTPQNMMSTVGLHMKMRPMTSKATKVVQPVSLGPTELKRIQ